MNKRNLNQRCQSVWKMTYQILCDNMVSFGQPLIHSPTQYENKTLPWKVSFGSWSPTNPTTQTPSNHANLITQCNDENLPWRVSWVSVPLPRWWWWYVYRTSLACIYTGRSRPSCPGPLSGLASGPHPDSSRSVRPYPPSCRPLWILSICSGPLLTSPDRGQRLWPIYQI